MTLSRRTRSAVTFLAVAILSLAAKAQVPAPNTTEWENEALKLRLFYPSALTKADTEQVMHDGHLTLFDGVFAVLKDNDAAITRAALAWAEAEGRINEASPETVATLSLSDADIDALVAERTQAKKTRNFARADAIRNDLLAKGILIEDSKDGVRWKRK